MMIFSWVQSKITSSNNGIHPNQFNKSGEYESLPSQGNNMNSVLKLVELRFDVCVYAAESCFLKVWRYMRSILLMSWLNEKISPDAISAYQRNKRGPAAAFPLSVLHTAHRIEKRFWFSLQLILSKLVFKMKLIAPYGFRCYCLLMSTFWRKSEGETMSGTMNELNQSKHN